MLVACSQASFPHHVGASIILMGDRCVRNQLITATATYNSSTGTVSVQVNGVTAGAVYYLSIKYNPGSLVRQKVTKPYPTASYTCRTYLDGAEIISSWDSVNEIPK